MRGEAGNAVDARDEAGRRQLRVMEHTGTIRPARFAERLATICGITDDLTMAAFSTMCMLTAE